MQQQVEQPARDATLLMTGQPYGEVPAFKGPFVD
jgi:hypothetical protein